MLFSNDRLLPANQRYDEGIREALDPDGNQSAVTFFAEFLDAIRLNHTEQEDLMADYLAERYRNNPPDLLVALGPQALNFFSTRRETLFPGTSLVVGGTSEESLARVKGLSGIAGLPMDLSVAPALDALLSVRPETREVLLVHGTSGFDRSWRDKAIRQCAPFAGRVKITDFPELPLEEMKSRLSELSAEKAVIYLTYFQSPTGETYTPAWVAKDIAAASAVPVMGPYDTYIGSGVLGASVSPFKEEGKTLGQVIKRILAGEKPEAIGILPSNRPRLIFDARQLKRWNIRNPPEGAELRFRSHTLWEEHRTAMIVGFAVVATQGLLITGLIFTRLRQKRAEKELRFSETRFSGIFRGSPVAIAIVRQADGRIVDVNPEWEAITGMTRRNLMGRDLIEAGMIIGGNARERLRLFLESGKTLHDFEQQLRTPEGLDRVLSLSTELIPLHDDPCYIIVAKDVTERHELEISREKTAQTSRLAMLGEMTASIAHEINQPLGAMLSNADAAEMLLDHPEPPMTKIRTILTDIRSDTRRASQVIKRVRALVSSREIQRVPLAFNDLLIEAARLSSPEAARHGVTINLELADDLPLMQIDPIQVEQVILNLLSNAMDAMKETPVAVRKLILRSERRYPDSVAASVIDHGSGIPEERIDRIFDSFYTTKEGGMGLGLALARSIAEAHGGSMHAENNASRGATFHLVLPVSSLI